MYKYIYKNTIKFKIINENFTLYINEYRNCSARWRATISIDCKKKRTTRKKHLLKVHVEHWKKVLNLLCIR